MELRKLIAIIRSDRLEAVEDQLQANRVKGISITHVKGYGEHSNVYSHDWLEQHARIEVFAERAEVERVARIIMDAAHSGVEGDGLVVILPVEKIYRVRTKEEVREGEI